MADMDREWTFIDEADVEEIKAALENQDLPSVVGKIQDYFSQLDHVELNIAVTGESGSGKSTFINAFRDMGHEEDGSASTGVVETTVEPKAYPHPKYPNVKMWDLPGIGTPTFKADKYLEDVQFKRYDFFIIVTSDRFRECHAQLATQIQKMGKRFYFLRNKIDHNIEDEKRSKPTTFNKDKIIDMIRQDCIKGLQTIGIPVPDVFLISCFDLGLFDFHLLQETMERELPEQKRHVLLLALPNITLKINQKKKKALRTNIWKVALLSGLVAAVPVPGLSFSVDVAILVKEIRSYYKAFSLDDVSLQKLAERSGVPVEELRAALKSVLNNEINQDVVQRMLTGGVGAAMESVFEYMFSTIPVLGSFVAGGMSFATVYYMLNTCLEELADDAHNVLMKALETPV